MDYFFLVNRICSQNSRVFYYKFVLTRNISRLQGTQTTFYICSDQNQCIWIAFKFNAKKGQVYKLFYCHMKKVHYEEEEENSQRGSVSGKELLQPGKGQVSRRFIWGTAAIIFVGVLILHLFAQTYSQSQLLDLEAALQHRIQAVEEYVRHIEDTSKINFQNLINVQGSSQKEAIQQHSSLTAATLTLEKMIKEVHERVNSTEQSIRTLREKLESISEKMHKYEMSYSTLKAQFARGQESNIKDELIKVREAIEGINQNIKDISIIKENKKEKVVKYAQLPLDLSQKNSKNQRIEEVLYPDEQTRKKRVLFYEQRAKFVDSIDKKRFPGIQLAKYNQIHASSLPNLTKDLDSEYQRLEEKFSMSKVAQELPMCIISNGRDNEGNFRIEYSLNSVFTQNYTNYKIIVTDDASDDRSAEIYRKYFDFYAIDPAYYLFIENPKRSTALDNFIKAAEHCGNDSIVVTLDADDEFIGRNVLKVINWVYVTKKAGVVYSNFIYWPQPQPKIQEGFTSAYTQQEKNGNQYRDIGAKFSHLRTFRMELFSLIAMKDLQDDKGEFFKITCDVAIYLPLMELACGRVEHINEFQYLYNTETGLNDYIQLDFQKKTDKDIRAKKKYQCHRPFDQKMKSLP